MVEIRLDFNFVSRFDLEFSFGVFRPKVMIVRWDCRELDLEYVVDGLLVK